MNSTATVEQVDVVNCNADHMVSLNEKKEIIPIFSGIIPPAGIFKNVDGKICSSFTLREDEHVEHNEYPDVAGMMAVVQNGQRMEVVCNAACKWHIRMQERQAKLLAKAAKKASR